MEEQNTPTAIALWTTFVALANKRPAVSLTHDGRWLVDVHAFVVMPDGTEVPVIGLGETPEAAMAQAWEQITTHPEKAYLRVGRRNLQWGGIGFVPYNKPRKPRAKKKAEGDAGGGEEA